MRSWEILARQMVGAELWPEAAEVLQRIARRAPSLFAPADILAGGRASARWSDEDAEEADEEDRDEEAHEESELRGGARVGDRYLRLALREWAQGGWRRPLRTWQPWGRTPGRLGASLIVHLCWEVPLPPALASAYMLEDELWGGVARDVARGISFREAIAVEPRFEGIPRRVWTALEPKRLAASSPEELTHALLLTWFGSLGLSDKRARLVARLFSGQFRRGVPVERWRGAFAWLARAGRRYPRRDYYRWLHFVRAQFNDRPQWSLARRAPHEVRAQVNRWFDHERRAPDGEALREVFPECDCRPLMLETVDPIGTRTRWWIRQIRTGRDLYREGLYFDHCVFTYREELRDGDSTIWSLTRDGRPCLTIEVSEGAVVQVRGRFNRLAAEEERGVVGQWASRNQLRVASDAHEE